jgi:DNA polymerase III alpha subunit
VIVDIKRKKDKNNNPFAYIDLCTSNQIIEGTIWSRQLKEYYELIEKGNCVCILGRKSENHLFVEKVKDYNVWLEDIRHKRINKKYY